MSFLIVSVLSDFSHLQIPGPLWSGSCIWNVTYAGLYCYVFFFFFNFIWHLNPGVLSSPLTLLLKVSNYFFSYLFQWPYNLCHDVSLLLTEFELRSCFASCPICTLRGQRLCILGPGLSFEHHRIQHQLYFLFVTIF